MARLILARYRITLRAFEPLDLPAYLGSTLRGAFGHAFRRLCCPSRPGESRPIPEECPYHLVFETAPPPGADALSTHDEIPRPFVIAPPPASASTDPNGAEVVFDLTLVGRARQYLSQWAGIVGDARYDGDLRPFWPFLVFGQWTHVGKGATFGLGGYRLAPASAGREAA